MELGDDFQAMSYDGVTGLPSLVFFNEILSKILHHAKRRNKILAILIIDIVSFENIKFKFGHDVSSQILNEMAKRITTLLRAEDISAKFDSNQFVILLNDIGKPKFASSVAEKILSVCSDKLTIAHQEFSIPVNIGICIYPYDGTSLEELLTNAESALFKAKKSGENTYQLYSQKMNIEAHEFIQFENALRKAIASNELSLYYQPILHIKQGKIISVEALLRWKHPELGILNPMQFIPIAEETGLIMAIGDWVLNKACQMNKHWQDEGYEHVSIAINLSSKQFHHPDIAQNISFALKNSGLNPNYLEIEIDEATIMDNIDMTSHILENIKSTGVKVSISHFGAGYISISHLKRFPISTVKIDSSFIKGLPYIPNDMEITKTFIDLAHNLSLTALAEGVETGEQMEYLAAQNCDLIQGYYLSRPVPEDKIILQFKKLSEEVIF